MAQRNYSLGLKGDGYAMMENGIVKILNDQVYICDLNIVDFAREFEGHWVEIAFCDPQPTAAVPIDPEIAPLVKALTNRGVLTLSSCAGHMLIENRVHYPFVSVYGPLDVPLAEGWTITHIGTNVYRLRTIKEASSEEEIAELQATIKDQVAVL